MLVSQSVGGVVILRLDDLPERGEKEQRAALSVYYHRGPPWTAQFSYSTYSVGHSVRSIWYTWYKRGWNGGSKGFL